jgi:hypothetical protein
LTSSGVAFIIVETGMDGHTCYHCKQWIEAGEAHDCWTTTEAALTSELDDELRDAWERLREAAAGFGEQRIYASHKSIMFARQSCYFFVRPKRQALELNVFLGRAVQAPQIRKVIPTSATKKVHVLHVRHRDEVEAPITDWLREAYEFAGQPRTGGPPRPKRRTTAKRIAKQATTKRPKTATPRRRSNGGLAKPRSRAAGAKARGTSR